MAVEWLCRITLTAYLAVLAVLCIYGLHRCFLVWLFYRVRSASATPAMHLPELPVVTVQLPMYNERYVAGRVIERACRIEYPRDRLEVQILDDSTDETIEIARATTERLRAAGHNVVHIHRTDRIGFKAGALEAGLKVARGEFIAIFDADFLPPQNILLETVHHFADPTVGMVQTRWDHLNRTDSLLTQAQAILLDGHFVVEHTARNRTGRYMSFNGTAGIWRKAAIEDAGGWQHDTLTEDLDLSYRAQLRGWNFVFRPELTSPAELPPEMNAFKAQQHRWTKGGAQTCLKLLPAVFRGAPNWKVKLEAFFHLTSCVVYVLTVALTLLIGPAMWAKLILPPAEGWWQPAIELMLFVAGFGSATAFYVVSQRHLLKSWPDAIRYVPALMAVGIGIAFNNAVAALEGLFGRTGEFVRTPKFGDASGKPGEWRRRMGGLTGRRRWQAWAELLIGVYLLLWTGTLFFFEGWFERVSAALPFLAIFIVGYFYISVQTFATQLFGGAGETCVSAK